VRLAALILVLGLSALRSSVAQAPDLKTRTPETVAAKQQAERRITLDIQVNDASGNPVHGLDQKDFQLLDHGSEQPLASFQEVAGRTAQPPVEAILVLDAMNATFEDVGLMRQGIEAFLQRDSGQLPLPVSIVFLTDRGIKIDKPSRNGLELVKSFAKLETPIRVLDSSQGISGAMDRVQRSLQALKSLSEYEATKPGRKLLLWMGPGWPLLAGVRSATPSAENSVRYYSSIVAATTSLRRAQITLYSVAPLNLYHDNGQSAFVYKDYLKGVTTPNQADSPYLGVQVLATHSGGLVLNKSGDLPSQIDRCLADADWYYEVTFDASTGNDLGEYRSIEVRVDRPGVSVRTNNAYYAGPAQNTGLPTPPSESPTSTTVATATIRAQTHLVLLDVTILDKSGQPITGLTASDFQLQEDKTPQTIGSFEEHKATESPAPPPAPLTADGTITATNKPPANALWNVVAVDLLNTSKDDRGHLQQQLQDFARQLPADTPVALVAMRGNIRILSSFADGPAGLTRALKKGLGPLEIGVPADIIERQEVTETISDDPATVQNKANIDVQRQAERAQATLGDFSSIARWLKPYRGRKNVFWISAGFPLEGHPFGLVAYNSMHPEGLSTHGSQRSPMQEKTDKEFESARIAIYPIDVRGVAVSDIAGETTADTAGPHGKYLTNATKDDALTAGRHQEMFDLAAATGGVVRINNDLTKSLRDAFMQGATYYTLSYTPQNTKWDGTYHRIHIELNKSGLNKPHMNQSGTQLLYRQGYYARDTAPDPEPTREQFLAALQPGAAHAASLRFAVKITAAANSADATLAIEPSTVQFVQDSDGKLLVDLDCALVEFTAEGKVLDKSLVRLSQKTIPGELTEVASKPLNATESIPLHPGASTLVLGVQDRATGRFGTLQVDLPNH
jgi:VWFA-related protein